MSRVHAFGDDALRDLDAVGVAAAIASGEVSAGEVLEAAIARAEAVNPQLNAIQHADFDRARAAVTGAGVFAGVPTFVKDNTDVEGLPTDMGSLAVRSHPATTDEPFTTSLRATGVTVLGKTTMPEFGWNATTEYATLPPTRNPWDLDFSSGASSGGAAALVAAGVVPLAHGNDGGGSIRIPAAACGLVGLKPTRGRVATAKLAHGMPVDVVSNGVLTRSVRDTAHFLAAAQTRGSALPELPLVEGPADRRLRIGVILDSVTGTPTDAETRAAVTAAAELLSGLGHHVEPAALPVDRRFVDDFSDYWCLLAFSSHHFGRQVYGRGFDKRLTDPLTRGLARRLVRRAWRIPRAIQGLKRAEDRYRAMFADLDVVLSPVVSHTTPRLGHLSPAVEPFEEMFGRLVRYAAFTPINNAAGGPGLSLPLSTTTAGLPIGVQFSAAHGDERTLLELAHELEAARPFARIQA